jgi:hypothetical protein
MSNDINPALATISTADLLAALLAREQELTDRQVDLANREQELEDRETDFHDSEPREMEDQWLDSYWEDRMSGCDGGDY